MNQDQPILDKRVRAVYLGTNNEAELFNRAAQWIASKDGAVEIQAVHWRRHSYEPSDDDPMLELHIYFEPQPGWLE